MLYKKFDFDIDNEDAGDALAVLLTGVKWRK
jgi:hypothetical protein